MDFRILLVEDNDSDISAFRDSIDRINDSHEDINYDLVAVNTIDDAKQKAKEQTFQGSVVDIKLRNDENGNDFIKYFMESYRIPIVVLSGTPDCENDKIKLFIKGEQQHDVIVEELKDQYYTGIFKVLGGEGVLESNISNIFWNVLYPHIDIWKKYSSEDIDTEQILIRYMIAHLLEQLDDNGPVYCTEEMYVSSSKAMKTGAIYKEKESNQDFILLSPPCDIALHDNKMDTDQILLCEIESVNWEDYKDENSSDRKNKISSIVKNNKGNYHWLPDNTFYKGGRVNFRKIRTCTPEELEDKYEFIKIKLQNSFVKNVLQRFSSYYARQGQPDFDRDKEIDERIKKCISSK